ncbi:hypothetical protein QFC20_004643 [Naganishia adeliensis]|uniref:Uncharacterized protein n=1 Tax=Naganishia adeliensis TaxID=92952 RepID=A0ACC2VZM1_9TREE|nr:hypothetical protein QFC20_004643 [Naganishia adeliensis]
MQPSSTAPLMTFQPVLPSLNTILKHINTQNGLQAQFQAESTNGNFTDKQEEELHAYDEKISRQALQVRQSLLEQAKTAYTPNAIPGSQFSLQGDGGDGEGVGREDAVIVGESPCLVAALP